MTDATKHRHDTPKWEEWQPMGCGVESLHEILRRAGVEVPVERVLAEALARDGYDETLGWRHVPLVEVARVLSSEVGEGPDGVDEAGGAEQARPLVGEPVGGVSVATLVETLVTISRDARLEPQAMHATRSGTLKDSLGSPPTVAWMVSVNAPEQFECTHLIAVHVNEAEPEPVLDVFWPQGHPTYGERFHADPTWLGPKMTGRAMRFWRE